MTSIQYKQTEKAQWIAYNAGAQSGQESYPAIAIVNYRISVCSGGVVERTVMVKTESEKRG